MDIEDFRGENKLEILKISVIIPVYNVETYLKECINSVLAQTYKNTDIILVDDGSTDKSREICDDYEKKYKNIRTIHKENGGLSDARNVRIKNMIGDYACFLDSDDFFDDNAALARLVDRLEKNQVDLLNYSYKKYYESLQYKKPQFENIAAMPKELKCVDGQLEYIFDKSLYIASACNKLIKKELLQKEMWFEKGKLSEDIEWCAKLLSKVNSIDFVCENFYCYRQREGSITHTIGEKACRDLESNIMGCLEICEAVDDIKRRNYILEYTAYQLGTFFVVQAIAGKCSDSYVKRLAEYKWILKYHANNKKVKWLYWGTRILGFTFLCKILRLNPKYR